MSRHASPEDRDLELLAATLEGTGDFRVLRRLAPLPTAIVPEGTKVRSGLFVDTETTGLDPDVDEIIELAMVPFRYTLDGQIVQVSEPFEALRDPGRPLPEEIVRLTGITDGMLAGKTINALVVRELVAAADLIVAHNAGFDRRFLERLDPFFACKAWACSLAEVDWKAEGFEGTKLAYLAMGAGFFYDRHRAANDCLAALALLARTLPISGRPAMSFLLERARRSGWHIRANDVPFAMKDILKKRGYRWSAGSDMMPKAWCIDVTYEARDEEVSYLKREIYNCERTIPCLELSAFNRFSDRAG
ncbi:3'-5' exonuclease [Tardiphaga sp.]|uniref:3'-5' exonuclease n=1 Tax=Tardiphaga sp. TaxID=1926292 RepID=UPI0037DA3B23